MIQPPAAPAAARAAPPPPARALVPREHGAYGQLALPLLTALALGHRGAAPWLLAVATVLAFVAHEPLLVLLGQRGARARAEAGRRARRLLLALGAAALAAGAAGLALAPAPARGAAVLCAALVLAVAFAVARRREKTLWGELLVVAALCSGGLLVALAGGATPLRAGACWVAWTLAFAAATLAVRVILARARSKGERDPGVAHAAATLLLLAAGFGLAASAGLPVGAALALAPNALLAFAVCLLPIPARRLRELGWAMVGTGALTLVLLVAALS